MSIQIYSMKSSVMSQNIVPCLPLKLVVSRVDLRVAHFSSGIYFQDFTVLFYSSGL